MKNEYFNYKFVDGDSTIKEVQYKERFYGYNETRPLAYDSSYQQLYEDIINDKIIMRNYSFPFNKINKKFVRDSINLWSQLGIKLTNVHFLDKSYIVKKKNFVIDDRFKKAINIAHVKYIPIDFTIEKRPNAGCDFFQCASDDFEDKDIIIEKIRVPVLNDKLSSCVYGHEIAHSQLINVGQSTHNILNTETIPIFIEQLFASKIDTTNRSLLRWRYFRLCNLVENLNNIHVNKNLTYVSKIEYDTYNQSTLQAIKLFNTYSFSNSNVKKEMISYINNIFAGEVLIEDMLNQFEANLDEVPKNLKILKKIKR